MHHHCLNYEHLKYHYVNKMRKRCESEEQLSLSEIKLSHNSSTTAHTHTHKRINFLYMDVVTVFHILKAERSSKHKSTLEISNNTTECEVFENEMFINFQ